VVAPLFLRPRPAGPRRARRGNFRRPDARP
jgi:hypothetical protein